MSDDMSPELSLLRSIAKDETNTAREELDSILRAKIADSLADKRIAIGKTFMSDPDPIEELDDIMDDEEDEEDEEEYDN